MHQVRRQPWGAGDCPNGAANWVIEIWDKPLSEFPVVGSVLDFAGARHASTRSYQCSGTGGRSNPGPTIYCANYGGSPGIGGTTTMKCCFAGPCKCKGSLAYWENNPSKFLIPEVLCCTTENGGTGRGGNGSGGNNVGPPTTGGNTGVFGLPGAAGSLPNMGMPSVVTGQHYMNMDTSDYFQGNFCNAYAFGQFFQVCSNIYGCARVPRNQIIASGPCGRISDGAGTAMGNCYSVHSVLKGWKDSGTNNWYDPILPTNGNSHELFGIAAAINGAATGIIGGILDYVG